MRTDVLEESILATKVSLFGGDSVRVSGIQGSGAAAATTSAERQDTVGDRSRQAMQPSVLAGPADNSVSYIIHLKIFLCIN